MSAANIAFAQSPPGIGRTRPSLPGQLPGDRASAVPLQLPQMRPVGCEEEEEEGFVSETDQIPDWVNLPAGCEPWDLYSVVHDGILVPGSCSLALETSELQLALRVPHVAAHHKLPVTHEWRLTIETVESIRIVLFRDAPPGAKRGVEVSISWEEFAARLSHSRCDVLAGELVAEAAGAAIHLGFGFDGPFSYGELWARGGSASITGEDRAKLTPEAFISLGEAYWRMWANQNQTSRS